MTQEDKELLLKDLSARLTYKIIIYRGEKDYIGEEDALLEGVDVISGLCKLRCLPEGNVFVQDHIVNIIPYLRPMSSMTEVEKEEYDSLYTYIKVCIDKKFKIDFSLTTDWLNKHHFDYRGLIEKGLAIEAPYWMYKPIISIETLRKSAEMIKNALKERQKIRQKRRKTPKYLHNSK